MTPTRETFGNIPLSSQLAFYALAAASMAVFAWGVYRRWKLWRLGTSINARDLITGSLAAVWQKIRGGAKRVAIDAGAQKRVFGHGVGTFLGVHEGPQRISKAGQTIALEPGMVISNEPGYYKTGAYGIRIENLVAVREAKAEFAEKPLLEFETLTLAPIDLAMVEPSLLNREEKAWLNAYHARVRETLSPLVDAETKAWLESATRAL